MNLISQHKRFGIPLAIIATLTLSVMIYTSILYRNESIISQIPESQQDNPIEHKWPSEIPTFDIESISNRIPEFKFDNDPDDIDNDGLTYDEERKYGTNPYHRDTDYDGLLDGAEVKMYHTIPISADSDFDYIADSWELFVYHTDPLITDMDGDGLNDGLEIWLFGSDVRDSDTDNDFLNDFDEVRIWGTEVLRADSDGDGLADGVEVHIYNTDPNEIDTDGDSLTDGWEIANNHDPTKQDNWDKIFGVYILVPTLGLVFILIGIFASVDLKLANPFRFQSFFQKKVNLGLKQQQLLELLAVIPDNEQINVMDLAKQTGESVEIICQLLSSVLNDSEEDDFEFSPDNIVIHNRETSQLIDYTCFYCKEVVDATKGHCEFCKEDIARCKMCERPISYDDNYATCTSYGVFGEETDIYGYMTLELICESCLMNSRYNYI